MHVCVDEYIEHVCTENRHEHNIQLAKGRVVYVIRKQIKRDGVNMLTMKRGVHTNILAERGHLLATHGVVIDAIHRRLVEEQ